MTIGLRRNYIVQTEEQYIFIYEAINEALQSGQTEIVARNLFGHLQRLLQPINDSSLTDMELEFKVTTLAKARSRDAVPPVSLLSASPMSKHNRRSSSAPTIQRTNSRIAWSIFSHVSLTAAPHEPLH